MSDPDNTRQTSSNGNPPRGMEDPICITDPEHLLKKNVAERDSYEQRKENQSRKQYSLRSKTKEQKEESDREFRNTKHVKQKTNLSNGNK